MRTIYKNSLDAMASTPRVPKAQLQQVPVSSSQALISSSQNLSYQINNQDNKKLLIKEEFCEESSLKSSISLLQPQQEQMQQQQSQQSQQQQVNASTSQMSSTANDLSSFHHSGPSPSHCLTDTSSNAASSSELALLDSSGNTGGLYEDGSSGGLPMELNSFACPLDGCDFWSTNEQELKTHFVDSHVKTPPPTNSAGSGTVQNYVFKCIRDNCDELLVDVDAFLKHLQMHDKLDLGLLVQQQNLQQQQHQQQGSTTKSGSGVSEKKEVKSARPR